MEWQCFDEEAYTCKDPNGNGWVVYNAYVGTEFPQFIIRFYLGDDAINCAPVEMLESFPTEEQSKEWVEKNYNNYKGVQNES